MPETNITREVVIADAHVHFDRVHVNIEVDMLDPAEARHLAAKLTAAAEAAEQFDSSSPESWLDEAKEFFENVGRGKTDESGR